jgi:hypothetical protein
MPRIQDQGNRKGCPGPVCGCPAVLKGPALRKEPRSRKVDKCGTVFEKVGFYATVVRDNGMRWVISNVKRP